MVSLRELRFDDLFKFNALVFDPLTEVYGLQFFVRHLLQWPELNQIGIAPGGQPMGYIFGKSVGTPQDELHGHICALTVSTDYRRLGLATALMNYFTDDLERRGAWYVDLFMRQSNVAAHSLYRSLGFMRRRLLLDYYPGSPPENGYDLRKPLSRDIDRKSLVICKTPVRLPDDDDDDSDY